MKRKLVKHGKTTLMVSLPAEWTQRQEAKKGDEVNIENHGNLLTINFNKNEEREVQSPLHITTLTESSIRTALTNLYRLGYDRIEVRFQNRKAFEIIEQTVKNNLIGFEVISHSPSDCVISNITEPAKEKFGEIFSKLLENIDYLFCLCEDMLNGTQHQFESTERQIQAFDNFCRRVLSNARSDETRQLRFMFHSELIHAQRELYHLMVFLSKQTMKADDRVMDLFNKCRDMFDALKKGYQEKKNWNSFYHV